MIDATYQKAYRTASILGVKKGLGHLIGRIRRGMNTKLRAITDANGRSLRFFIMQARSAIPLALQRCSTTGLPQLQRRMV